MENKKWYINQQVWDKTVSYEDSGKIIHISDGEIFPITVEFKECNRTYTVDGRNSLFCVPTLSTKPYEIKMEGFSQEVEEELPKKGQIVWGLIHDVWEIGYFIGKDEYDSYILSSNNLGIPTNKYNTITIKNPYEDSDVSILENTDREPQIGDICFFWNDRHIDKSAIVCGKLSKINTENNSFYAGSLTLSYKHCSLKNPLIK